MHFFAPVFLWLNLYWALPIAGSGSNEQAHRLLEHALAIQTQTLGPDNPEARRSLALLGSVVKAQDRLADSEKLLRQALAGQQRVLGPDPPETMEAGVISQTR